MNKERTMNPYGYADKKPALQKRLRRIEGQIRGISNMVDEDQYCIDILTQVSAAKAALDKVALELLRDHANHCLTNDEIQPNMGSSKADELVRAVGRMI